MSPRVHMKPSSTFDFGRFVAFEEHQFFLFLTSIEIVILVVYYTIPFDFSLFREKESLFRHFWSLLFNFLYYMFG